jgi:hypothetical protein
MVVKTKKAETKKSETKKPTKAAAAEDVVYERAREHVVPSPFPMTAPDGDIVDEMCQCGRLRSAHADMFAYGHGPSFDGRCEKFTWKAHAYASDGIRRRKTRKRA